MSLQFVDGFDKYDPGQTSLAHEQLLRHYSGIRQFFYDVEATGGRFGEGCWDYADTLAWATRNMKVADDGHVVGFAARMDSAALQFQLMSGTNVIGTLQVLSDGRIQVHIGNFGSILFTSTETLQVGSGLWYFIEWKYIISNTVGFTEVRVHETSWGSFSGDTQPGGDTVASSVRFRGSFAIDDYYVLNNQGAVNNDYLGDIRIQSMSPNGDGSQLDWTPVPSGSHFIPVRDLPDDKDATFITSGVVGERDLLTVGDMVTTPTALHAVQVSSAARKTDAGVRQIRQLAKSGATVGQGSVFDLSTDFLFSEHIFEVNPDTGSPWTRAEVEGMEIGVEVAA